MLDPDQALRAVLQRVATLPVEVVSLVEARERVLAEDVRALRDHPPADNSAMDGWALIDEDTGRASAAVPCRLAVVGRAFAGHPFGGMVAPGSAVRITTGAQVPRGATAVVPQELVTDHGASIELRAPLRAGAHIRRAGEEYHAGDTILPAGATLGPAAIGLLASAGVGQVRVVRLPRVAVLVTGDELVDIDHASDRTDLLVDSNGPLLRAALGREGVPVVQTSRLADDAEALARAIRDAAEVADMILTTGSASVGPADVVAGAWADAGVETVFWKVAMRPGKPVRFGVVSSPGADPRAIPCFALPGNPLAVMSGFERFVRPAIDRMRGREPSASVRVRVPLEGGCDVGERAWFARGSLVGEGAGARFRIDPKQGSGMLLQAANGSGVAILMPSGAPMRPGDEVVVELDPAALRGRVLKIVDGS